MRGGLFEIMLFGRDHSEHSMRFRQALAVAGVVKGR